jgi:NAD(P)-dependent dehydrogenase (short-subunit alcohol dehydrogenase family)
MSTQDLTGTTALVTGASRGFGRAVAVSLSKAGAYVVAVARTREQLEELQKELGDTVTPVVADVADPTVAAELVDKYHPQTLVLNAGANPLAVPIQEQTWESFSQNWQVDVQQVFNWTRESLLRPLDPGSTVISFSSGAAIGGSPLSGGYAGSKATIRFISSYAGGESARAGLGIRFVAVLPGLSPVTDLGANGAAAYAALAGVDVDTFVRSRGPVLTLDLVGRSIVDLAADPERNHPAYMLMGNGLNPVG